LAFTQYVEDNNETFPPQDVSLDGALLPYLRKDFVLTGFTYTFGAKKVSESALFDTKIGYVRGQYGDSYMYASGHVEYEAR
jgi:hypothetical protein